MKIAVSVLTLIFIASACGGTEDGPPAGRLTKEQMMDPEACKPCHPDHYREWSGSMHAYSSMDPVMLALWKRGQRDTGGELGTGCAKCHAPMAVVTGATTDGSDLEKLPSNMRSVNCYFCHVVKRVDGTHSNPLVLADDLVMRGPYADPVPTPAHESAYSPYLDRRTPEGSLMCGACHDVILDNGTELERVYLEWTRSLWSNEESGRFLGCGGCHTRGRDQVTATGEGMPIRRYHDHSMPGVDVALTPFPQAEEQKKQVQAFLDSSLAAELCVRKKGAAWEAEITLENVAAAHGWPTGVAMNRRAWVEVMAYDDAEQTLLESGKVADDVPLDGLQDPNLWQIRDWVYDKDGNPATFPWEVSTNKIETLPAPTSHNPLDPNYKDTHVVRTYAIASAPARVTMRVRIRPMALSLLDELVKSGDLDVAVRNKMPTFTLAPTELEWKASAAVDCVQ